MWENFYPLHFSPLNISPHFKIEEYFWCGKKLCSPFNILNIEENLNFFSIVKVGVEKMERKASRKTIFCRKIS